MERVVVLCETKAQTRARLEAEGRWTEFWKRRDVLKASGMTSGQAQAAAVAEFQPLDGQKAEYAGRDGRQAKPVCHKRRQMKWRDHVEWVYRHLTEDNPRYTMPGVKTLHEWARANQDDFFKIVLPRLLPSRAEIEAAVGAQDGDEGQGTMELVNGWLREEGAARESQDGAAGPDGEPAVPAAPAGTGTG